MKPEQFLLARDLLKLTQYELAQVLGVHSRTVSKWERGELQPSGLQLDIFRRVLRNASDGDPRAAGRCIRLALDTEGQAYALYLLLLCYAVDGL